METRVYASDSFTPVAAYLALRNSDPNGASFLFESVVGGERWGRYSILGYRPSYEAVLMRSGWSVSPMREGRAVPPFTMHDEPDPLRAVSQLFDRAATPELNQALKFAKSHVGYLAWDLVHLIDKVPPGQSATWDAHEIPLARFLGEPVVVVFDSLAQTITIAGSPSDIDDTIAILKRGAPLSPLALPTRGLVPSNVSIDMSDEMYEAQVLRAKEYIKAGDAFQVVLARTFSVPQEGRDPFDVYRAMRLLNPSPYMYFVDLPAAPSEREKGKTSRMQILGASPETLVRLENDTMTVRPIAGTRPRGKTEAEDKALERELLADPKELAEHVMLIDLGRNDVGRVAEVGSVELVRKMDIERYSHVMHIVSEVRGKIARNTHPFEVARSAFPAGTLSGAPKVRAMQIIRELEARPRGIYGGAVGYMTKTGDFDFAIAIRTAVCRDGMFTVTAGAGIVEASDPKSEAEETRNKARGVLAAIAAAT